MIDRKMKKLVASFAAMVVFAALCGPAGLAQGGADGRADGQIEMDVVHALDGAAQLKSDLITAATVQGEVTLAGTVSSESSRQLAESLVKGVPGVVGVNNNLKVGNPNDDPNAQNMASDAGDDSGPVGQQNAPSQSAQGQPYAPAEPVAGQNSQVQGQYNQVPPPQNAQGQAPDWGQAGPPPAYPQNGQAGQYPDQGQYNQGAPPQSAQGQVPDWGPAGPPPDYPQSGQQNGQYYPAQPGYGQQPYRQPYGPRRAPRYNIASGPITIPAGTALQVRTVEGLNSKHAVEGTPVTFTVISDVTAGGFLAIPRGAVLHGIVSYVRRPGQLTGSPELALQLTSLDLGGQTYPVQSDQFRVRGPSKTGRTVGNAIGGALLGAIIGGAAGGGGGAAIGAVAGGGAGTALSAASQGPGAWIPSEALVTFHLETPITVNPVGRDEAARLAQGLYPGGPTLYRRGGYYSQYPRRGFYSPYYGPANYGPVYYRPYYMVGGVYYWR